MELAVSSIAWTNEEEADVADVLMQLGVSKVEIAPTKLWDDPTQVSKEEALRHVKWWSDRGIEVVAFQSMLFARPDLKLFESDENRKRTADYMSKFLELAGTMGAKRLVFGSPKNRQKSELSTDQANIIATDFFIELGSIAAKNGVILCLEPNAPQYNCDFVTNAQDGDQLVRAVSSPGFGLHLDTACMSLAGDSMSDSIYHSADIMKHFHVSSPMLEQVEFREDVNHQEAANALKAIGYKGLVSIEMRPGMTGENVDRIEKAVRFTKDVYLS